MKTLTSYGVAPAHRQGELIRASGRPNENALDDPHIRALIVAIQAKGTSSMSS